MGGKLTLLLVLLVLLAGAGGTAFIFSTEPTARRVTATRATGMLVETTRAERGTFRPTLLAMGTVVPAQDIILSPRVSGEIIERSEAFTPGGYVRKGETLLRIDPDDYRNALRQRKSELQQAEADLEIEMGRQSVAEMDYELLGESLPEQKRELVLRQPQLNTAKARVEAARAAVNQAGLKLERTNLKAPFNAHVLTRKVNVGSQVSPEDNLGRLVGWNTYWVEARIPVARLRWLAFPDGPGELGAPVRVRNETAWPEGEYRSGHLYRLVGTLSDQTRMARVLVTVRDPLAHREENAGRPRLMIGSFVETHIRARELEDVVRLNRDYVRKDDTVWAMKEGKLDIQEVDVVLRDPKYAYVREGLSTEDRVVTTNLSTVAEGARLRVGKAEEGGAEPGPRPEEDGREGAS